MPQKAAHQHHALEPDVDHAAALGDHAAERREQQRRRVAERRRDQRRPGEHRLERRGRRVRRRDRAGDREQGDHDRARSRACARRRRSPRAGARPRARRARSTAPSPRTSIGGIVITHASAPRTRPAMPSCFGDDDARRRDGDRARRSRRRPRSRPGLLGGACRLNADADPPPALQQPERDQVGRDEQDDHPLDHERQVLGQRRVDARG